MKEVKLRHLKDGQYYYVWGTMADVTRPQDRPDLRCDIGQWVSVPGKGCLLVGGDRFFWEELKEWKCLRFFGPIPRPTLAELESRE